MKPSNAMPTLALALTTTLSTACSITPKPALHGPPEDVLAGRTDVEPGESAISLGWWPFTYNALSWARFSDDADELSVTAFRSLTPGFILGVPLWLSGTHQTHYADGSTAAAQDTVHWTPLWAWTPEDDDGGARGRGFDVSGHPLLVSGVNYADEANHFHYVTTFAMLGPTIVTASAGDDHDSWAFIPANAWGVGPLLWTSLSTQSSDHSLSLHGPLYGMLGYTHSTARSGQESESSTHVLGGALWRSHSRTDKRGNVQESSAGPLWGCIAIGRHAGRTYLSLGWTPIIPLWD